MRQGDRRRQCGPNRQVREHRFAQGRINEVEGLELVGGNAARALESHRLRQRAAVAGDRIVDSHAYMLALRDALILNCDLGRLRK